MAPITTRTLSVPVQFIGEGRITQPRPGTFIGGVPDPALTPLFGFNVLRTAPDEEGVAQPRSDEPGYRGALQVNLWGTSADYRALGQFFLALSELDARVDPGFHHHFDGPTTSPDGQTQVELIVRKLPEGPFA